MESLILGIEEDSNSHSFYAFNILKTKAKELFKKNNALFCLVKSDFFLKEFLSILNKLCLYDISPNQFLKIIQSCDISNIDKERLILCNEVFEFYIKTMADNNYKIPTYREKIIDRNLTEGLLKDDF